MPGVGTTTGMSTLNTGLQYRLFVNAPHEVIGPANFGVGWGHTGRVSALGAVVGPVFPDRPEAIIRATHAAGHGIGGLVQLHFHFDDLVPKSFGTPILQRGH